MKIRLKRINKAFHFRAIGESKIRVSMDANPAIGGKNKGTRPMELLLMSVAGCASIDLNLILKKQHQELVDYKVELNAERNDDVGKALKKINIHFNLWGDLDERKVERAIELTLTKYCSAVLSLDKEIDINYTYKVYPKKPASSTVQYYAF